MSDLQTIFGALPPEARHKRRKELTHALPLAEAKKAHIEAWEQYRGTQDHAAWDAWLMHVGYLALELRDVYQARYECDHGTAYDGCGCDGCEQRAVVWADIEGSGRGSKGLTGKWTQREQMREGLKLHASWVYKGSDDE